MNYPAFLVNRRKVTLTGLLVVFVSSTSLLIARTPTLLSETSDGPRVAKRASERVEARHRSPHSQSSDGRISVGPLRRAMDQRRASLLATRSRVSSPVAGLSSSAWTPRGPNNIGGITVSLLLHPADPNLIYAASSTGGIWKSLDRGLSWFHLDYPDGTVASMCIDPNDPNVLYVAKPFLSLSHGIYRSSDGGITWRQLPGTESWALLSRIAVVPGSTKLMFAAVQFGIDENGYISSGGIFRSADSGLTWSMVISGRGCDVSPDPTNIDSVVAAATVSDQSSGSGYVDQIFRSSDSGLTWTRAGGFGISHTDPQGGPNVYLARASSAPDIIYATTVNADLWRSTDGGKTFAEQNLDGTRIYGPTLTAPGDGTLVLSASLPLKYSVDSWQTFADVIGGSVDPNLGNTFFNNDNRTIAVEPGFDGVTKRGIVIGNDHGIYATDDIFTSMSTGIGWRCLNHSYESTQYYFADGDKKSGVLLGGTQDNGTLRVTLSDPLSPGGRPLVGGDGGQVAVDPVDSRFCYAQFQNLGLMRSADGCQTINDFIATMLPDSWEYRNAPGNSEFFAPMVLDPSDSRRMLAGGASLWRSDDVRFGSPPHWSSIRSPGTEVLARITIAPSDSNTIWIAQDDGTLYKTSNGLSPSPSWTQVAAGGDGISTPLPLIPSKIVIDWHDSQIVFVTYPNFWDRAQVWRTSDGGQSWINIAGSRVFHLPLAPIYAIAQHPALAKWLYAATLVGLYVTDDGGANWYSVDGGPGSIEIDDLSFLHNSTDTLLVATYGRGLWTAAIVPPVPCSPLTELCITSAQPPPIGVVGGR